MFLVQYFNGNHDSKNLLGEEIFKNIEECLSYKINDEKKIYLNKKFLNSVCYRWKILNIKDVEIPDFSRSLQIILQEVNSEGEEFLTKTLKDNKARGHGGINQLLHKGKIVEVEFGHYHSVYKINKSKKLGTNKRYKSTVQNGEMHKRRLAIVVKVQPDNMVQVVPITSKEPKSPSDKSNFKLEPKTLNESVYFSKEITSWVICSMIQTVSVTRILPLEKKRRYRQPHEHPRNNSYTFKISNQDSLNLDRALLYAVNLGKYYDYFNKNRELKLEKDEIANQIDGLRLELKDALKYKEACIKASLSLDDFD